MESIKLKCEISLRKNGSFAITVTKGKITIREWSNYKNIGKIAGGLIHGLSKKDLRNHLMELKNNGRRKKIISS